MEINEHNYKDVLLMRLEGELSPEEVLQAEAFVLVNEAAAKEWRLLQKTKLQPAEQVFFPKKHLLMREEEEVVLAPFAFEKVTGQEAVVRTIGGGFNYRKFAVPVSIAASLLLFFFFSTNKNIVDNNAENALAKTEVNQPEIADNSKIDEANSTSGNDVKTNIENTGQSDIEEVSKKGVGTQLANKTIKKARINKPHDTNNKAFLANSIYEKQAANNYENVSEKLNIVKVEIPEVLNAKQESLVPLKETSLAKQNKDLHETQKAKADQLALAQEVEMEQSTLSKLTSFFTRNVQLKKHTEEDANYYAFSLETEKIKIVKTFKSNF